MEAGARTRGPAAAASWLYGLRYAASDYVALTKPRVVSLLLVTTVCAMFVATPNPSLVTILLTVIGGYLAAGGAGAINHSLEREIDGCMGRTASVLPAATRPRSPRTHV